MNNDINKKTEYAEKQKNEAQNIEIKENQKKVNQASKNIPKKKNADLDKKNIEDLKLKLQENEDRVLRTLADNENLRKRDSRELDDTRKYASKNFALSLLTVVDNFQRAMQSLPKDTSEESDVLKNLITGIKAIEKELYGIFEKNGITSFSSLNQKFDPELHQAVSQINNEIKEGLIVEELQKGFKIGERLLRPAMVVVSKGPEKKKENVQKG